MAAWTEGVTAELCDYKMNWATEKQPTVVQRKSTAAASSVVRVHPANSGWTSTYYGSTYGCYYFHSEQVRDERGEQKKKSYLFAGIIIIAAIALQAILCSM